MSVRFLLSAALECRRFSEQVDKVQHCQHRVPEDHARPGVSHDIFYLHPLILCIAVHGTLVTGWLVVVEWTDIESLMRILP